MSDTIQEQLDALTDEALLKTITATLAKRQKPLTAEEQQAKEDAETYSKYYPGEAQG